MALRSEYRSAQKKSVKITLKYLPLHSMGNEDVLESVKEYCKVWSMVNYSNNWYNGHITNICNGDRFVYIAASDLDKVPDQINIGEYRARIFRPNAITTCKQCQKEGHCSNDDSCPTRAL